MRWGRSCRAALRYPRSALQGMAGNGVGTPLTHIRPCPHQAMANPYRSGGWVRMRGVTLIELLVTLSILMILIAAAVPSFQAALASNQVTGVTNDLISVLNMARSEAVARGETVTVCRSNDTHVPINNQATPRTGPSCDTDPARGWQSGWLVFVDTVPRGNAAGDIRLKVVQPKDDVVISSDINLASFVSYGPNGASRASGYLQISKPLSTRRKIVINNTGRACVEYPDNPAFPSC